MIQDKAQPAINGCPLNKGCNAVLGYLLSSRRARQGDAICGVAFLEKGIPFSAERVLQLTAPCYAENIKRHGIVH